MITVRQRTTHSQIYRLLESKLEKSEEREDYDILKTLIGEST
jgi:hypothetical protein